MEIILGLDPERDRSEIESLDLRPLTPHFLETTLIPRYEASGFKILDKGTLSPSDWPNLKTSWAKRLQGNTDRVLTYIMAQAIV
jgi:hypothetical protein